MEMYSLSVRTQKQNNAATVRAFIPYTQSEIEALIAGYVEVADDRAYNGRCFVKNGKKWIHNLNALRKKLNAEYGRYIDDEELASGYPEGFGYDVENYYSRFQHYSFANSNEFTNLMQQVKVH